MLILSSSGSPSATFSQFKPQQEARINDKLRITEHILNTAAVETASASFSFQQVNLR